MGSDMIVALREASAHGTTLFGLNHHATAGARHAIYSAPGQMHDTGEVVHTSRHELPQARQTFAVLGVQPVGHWGLAHGINEHRVAVGVTEWHSKLRGDPSALDGLDLVRLALERSRSAHQAVEVITDLLERHADGSRAGDYIFLLADANEAFVLETSGKYWAMLECGHTRVVTDAAMIRQDWRRLAPGLADFVIDKGWWRDDGSKIDFVGCLAEATDLASNAHKRWGHASLALAQQQGAIDLHFLRRMLEDHCSQNRELLPRAKDATLASSFLVDLHKDDQPVVAWIAFGIPKIPLHFPVCMQGELPAGFSEGIPASPSIQQRVLELQKLAHGKDRASFTTALERLQARFDQDAEDFLARAHDYSQHGKPYLVRQLATEMMHNHLDAFDREYRRLLGMEDIAPPPTVTEEVLFFA